VLGSMVNRVPRRYTTVNQGDELVITLGEREVRLPRPWHQEKLSSTPEGYLLFEGKLYCHVEDLDPSVRKPLQ
jgi:hypothetical protein